MTTLNCVRAPVPLDATLIRRVNQLYHGLTQSSFDGDHRYRHRVEKPFWEYVVHVLMADRKCSAQSCDTDRPPRVVVDLACGTGFVTETLGTRLKPRDHLIALDLAEAALKSTARKWANSLTNNAERPVLTCMACDGLKLPLADASVDLLAMNAALHHLPDPIATLAEIDRVLVPGGCFALGFEPNHTHFASPVITGLNKALNRLAWYLSPRQNRRRLQQLWCPEPVPAIHRNSEAGVAALINQELLRDGLITRPLPVSYLLDLVDPHARGARENAGFKPAALLARAMPGYEIIKMISTDYAGETARRTPSLRRLIDAVFRAIAPHHGSLFCWLVRKPLTEQQGVKRCG